MKLPIESADYRQLVKYAQNVLQLDVKHGSHNQHDLLALVRQAVPGIAEIEVEDAAPAVAAVTRGDVPLRHPNLPAHHYKNDPTIEVNIASEPGEGGDRHLPITVNGDMILVKRDEYVPIPYRHFRALETAVETQHRQTMDSATGRNRMVATDVNAVRYSYRNGPSEAEIADYHARNKDVRSGERRKAA